MVLVRWRFSIASVGIIAALLTARPCSAEEPNERLRQLIADVEPSVVTIEVPGVGIGSGFVISKDGVIATCYHVIEGAKEVRIKLQGGKSLQAIGFLAISPGKDIALVKVKSVEPLVPLPIAEEKPAKGDAVVAFGAPRGLDGTVTDGIVSAVRDGTDESIKNDEWDVDAVWIQTTAPISHGNSGGPLVDVKGNVVGINAWYRPGGQNLNFAGFARQASRLLEASGGSVRSFGNLPKPREVAARTGDAARTLAYWQQIARARCALDDEIGNEALPSGSDDKSLTEEERRAQQIADKKEKRERELRDRERRFHHSTYTDWERAYKKYAAEIRSADPSGVDALLTTLATLDAEHADKLAIGVRMLAKVEGQVDAATSAFFAQCASDILEMNRAYDFMRTHLVAKYDLPFRPINERPRTKSKAVAPSRPDRLAREKLTPEKLEEQAQKKLNLARSLMSAGKTSAANKRLSQIIADYPGTKAAEAAQSLLEKES